MTSASMFRNNPELNMGRYMMPGYTGHFPGQNASLGYSRGRATQAALRYGGYLEHDHAHSILEPNQDDMDLVYLKNVDKLNRQDHFDVKEHMQGGQPAYREQMLPGYTGHNPCAVDKIGRTFAPRSLEGTLEFERIRTGIPRYRFTEYEPLNQLKPIGGRDHKLTDVVDRELIPITATTPEFVPRYLGHRHAAIVSQFGLGLVDKTYSQFNKATEGQQLRGDVHPELNNPPIYRNINLARPPEAFYDRMLHYDPPILPTPPHPHMVPMAVRINQPIPMDIVVNMPSWNPTMAEKVKDYKYFHAKSGFGGFIPDTPNVLGESVRRDIAEKEASRRLWPRFEEYSLMGQ